VRPVDRAARLVQSGWVLSVKEFSALMPGPSELASPVSDVTLDQV
jgi:hypothetical protein